VHKQYGQIFFEDRKGKATWLQNRSTPGIRQIGARIRSCPETANSKQKRRKKVGEKKDEKNKNFVSGFPFGSQDYHPL
jgi:hypothetical protein